MQAKYLHMLMIVLTLCFHLEQDVSLKVSSPSLGPLRCVLFAQW